MHKKILSIFATIITLILPFNSFAHTGGLDSLGGHNVRTTGTEYEVGTYHYHKGTYAGWIVNNKGDIPNSTSTFNPKLIKDSINVTKASPWAIVELNKAYKAGLYRGVKNYISNKFQDDITRSEFCKLMVNYIQIAKPDIKPSNIQCNFKDLDKFGSETIKAYKYGIIKGFSNTEFKPNALITREQIACILFRYLDIYTDTNLNPTSVIIKDSDEISTWALEEVQSLVSLEIIKGFDSGEEVLFRPKLNTTVEQGILLIYRL